MHKKPLISVIVPVYKVEAYLDKCVSSIVNQTYRNLEIILVDDGSPDRSGEVCDEWAVKDSRICVIHQENAGGGAARNVALDIARGTYVSMIDSDDYIHPNMYTLLSKYMESDVDVVECEILKTLDDHAELEDGHAVSACTYSTLEAMRLHISDTLFRQTPPNKLYRRSAIADTRFPSGTGIDDEYWTYRVIGNSRKLVHIDCPMYAYRQHGSSVMHSLNIPRRLRAVEAKIQRQTYIEKRFPQLAALSRKNLWFTCIYQGQLALREMNQEEANQTIKYLRCVLGTHPYDLEGCTAKEKVWLSLARISLRNVCKLRNILKIGL